jgi:hypothetical protein
MLRGLVQNLRKHQAMTALPFIYTLEKSHSKSDRCLLMMTQPPGMYEKHLANASLFSSDISSASTTRNGECQRSTRSCNWPSSTKGPTQRSSNVDLFQERSPIMTEIIKAGAQSIYDYFFSDMPVLGDRVFRRRFCMT